MNPRSRRHRLPGFCCLLWLGLAEVAAGSTAPRIRIGVESNTSPLSFVDAQNQPTGFTAELLREVARVGDLDLDIVPGAWTNLLADFNADRLDALANVTITEERRATMDFSIGHAYTTGIAYFRSDRPAIRRTADMAGKKIATLRGSIGHLNALAHQGWGATIVPCASWQAALDATLREECDAALLIGHISTKVPNTHGLQREFVNDVRHQFHIAVHKGDSETLLRLNEALATVRQNRTFDRIYDKWITPISPRPIESIDLRPYYFPAAGTLIAVFFIIGWQRRVLHQRAIQAAALRETEERYRGLVESAFDGSVILQDGLIRSVNPAYAAMFGYTVEELIGRPVLELAPPEDREKIRSAIGGNQESPYETTGLRKDGVRIAIEIAGKACTYQGKPARIAAVRDISERKAAEGAIRQLNAELEQRVESRTAELAARITEVEQLNSELSTSQRLADRSAAGLQEANSNLLVANQELEAFSYSVSHDLRAPLRNITGFIELMRKRTDGKLDTESNRFLSTVIAETARMGLLIDDLLTFSRLGRTAMKLETVRLTELIDEVKVELHQDLADRTIEWRLAPLPLVQGDRALLRQVISNLVGNAVKFTRQRAVAVIEIGASGSRPGDPSVTIFVRDNGAGFNPKYVDKLFGVFQRLHNSRDFEGTGIGLANVKRIIHRHGGRVWAEGHVDNGATFYFTISPP